jgi:threonine dehydratase
MIPSNWLEEAAERIAPYIRQTPLTYIPQEDLYIKWENHQITGSFKVRGAFNKVLCLQESELARGLVAASAGNHGQGVALAGKQFGAQVTVFASEHADPSKVKAMQALSAHVILVPGGYGEAEKAGLEYAKSSQATWISPYNDGQVIAGQGTLGLEIDRELPALPESTWVIPAGSGGLVSGIGAAIENLHPRPRLVAVQSKASPFLYSLFHHNTQEGVVELNSIADGLAGPVEAGSLTIALARQYLDEFVLVSEQEIARAILYCWRQYFEKIEGSAAAALAAVLFKKVKQRPAVILISGGNIQPELHAQIIHQTSWER